MTAYILDTEAHALKDPHATEIAYIKVGFGETGLAYLEAKAFEQRYNPQQKISYGSMAITRIFDEDVANMPPHTDFVLPDDCQYLIGHHIDFDCEVLANAKCDLSPTKRICTLALARFCYPDLDSHTLGALLCYLYPEIAKKNLSYAHGAKYDIWFTFLVLKSMCQKLGIDNIAKLYQMSETARKPTHMTFGKYKGTAIVDLPSDYVDWLLKQSEIDAYLKLALESL
ncbi:putative quorum-sensing-regulated virulence factor [Faucicola boevrei]|uniref:putative quorum-sensing-regulated virulence factor n=1 Tax=Faucicola boevrei TaxID=346665 RepID=UPI00037AAD52|nr:DUF3820 family protein [Moraxella boevrei]